MRALWLLAAAALGVSGCTRPPPEAYLTGVGRGRPDQAIDLGQNSVGESCVQAPGSSVEAQIYCGAWQQPSARVRRAGPATVDTLASLAVAGSWRDAIDSRYICPQPRPAEVAGQPALRMDCTGRVGGWPHVALVALSGDQAWVADGVQSAMPAVAQSIAILSGRAQAKAAVGAEADAQLAARAGALARSTGDGRAYDTLMLQGARANLADEPGAAESAYGAALAIEEKAFGHDSPNLADPLVHLAVQVSNQGRFAEADAMFTRAEALAPQQRGDGTLAARLLHFEGLHALNQAKPDRALALLRSAEAGYTAVLPPEALLPRPPPDRSAAGNLQDVLATQLDRQNETALLGLIEARRNEAVALRTLGRLPDSDAALAAAAALSRSAQLEQPSLLARLQRTSAINAQAEGNQQLALARLDNSDVDFSRAFPGSRPLALVQLLRGQELFKAGQIEAAASVCRTAAQTLFDLKSGYEAERMSGCLDAFAAQAATRSGSARQAVLQDMFLASQLVRGSQTEQQIALASARLREANRDPRVADAIRQQQDASAALATIRRQRATEAAAVEKGNPPSPIAKLLEGRERAAAATLADRERDLQAASPNYGQLVQQASKASDLLPILRPGEAFAALTITADSGWTFLLRDGTIRIGRIDGGARKIDALVQRIRAAMEPQTPAFDTAAAQELYARLFGGVRGDLDGVKALTVAPTGSLLSLPFAVLLTGPADPARLSDAPWLVRQMAVAHLPSAGNFVSLRKLAGTSRAPQPWFGFGDFRPVTEAQARRSFGPACGTSASLLAHLPPLASARTELTVAGRLLGATANDELLGPSFTVAAVQHADLTQYRVLHFATHAILPSDLACQSEPAIVTSAPPRAPDASGALLTASDLAQIKLDADLVILSACNSGGPDGAAGGGESLSNLARSFFYGGARALLITHWEVSDQAATFTIADALRRMQADPALGAAGALQATQIDILSRSGSSLPAEFAHPFYWAPFALIGPALQPARNPV